MNGTPACRGPEPMTVAGDTSPPIRQALRTSWSARARVLCTDLYEGWVAWSFDDFARVLSGIQ